MKATVYLVFQFFNGHWADGSQDRCIALGVIFAADKDQAEAMMVGCGRGVRKTSDYDGGSYGEPFLEELETIETTSHLPIFMKAEE